MGHTHKPKSDIFSCISILIPIYGSSEFEEPMYQQGKRHNWFFGVKTKRFRKRHITPMCQGQLIIFTGYFFHTNLQFSTDNFLFCFFTLQFLCQVLKIYFYRFTSKNNSKNQTFDNFLCLFCFL